MNNGGFLLVELALAERDSKNADVSHCFFVGVWH